jgi:hypothetical protein
MCPLALEAKDRPLAFIEDRDQGALAQLGERLLCKQDVVGSIPSGSTKLGE